MEIKFNKVSYVYQNPYPRIALANINLEFKQDMINGIVGRSGSGKTTLIELINALLVPTSGTIKVGSRTISNKRKIKDVNNLRYKIGLVFQFPEEQFFCSTVKKEIEFGMKYFKKNTQDNDKHISDALKMVGLDDSYLERNPFNLSSGEMRKVAIASILAFNPRVVILDEPTIGLDNASRQNLIKIIRLLKTRYKKTVLIVTHDTDLLLKIADNVIVMNRGSIVLEGDKYEVFSNPKLEEYGVKRPRIIEFEKMVLDEKGIKIGYRDEINDLMKDVYRYVK